ncbi:MAG: hypothetical protein [Microvirus sp.]|nr:MAG: hypothetical protein [Microvirus sp.]
MLDPPTGGWYQLRGEREVKRMSVDKGRSAKQFRGNVSNTKRINLPRTVMRGGYRL